MNKKILTVFVILLALGAVFGSCKKDKKDDEVIELRVLNYFDMTVANASDEISKIWDQFEKNNPDIKIIREDYFNESFHEKTEAYAAAGQLPDVLYAWPSGRSTTLHSQHLIKDLGPLVKREGLSFYYTPVALDPSQQASGYLGILTQGVTATSAFYVNMEVLRDCGLEPAKTYTELKAQVPVLRAKGYDTILMANESAWVMQSCLFSLVAGRFCGEGWEQRILSGEAKFTDPDFVAALEFIKTMYNDGVLSKSTLNTGYGDVVGQFATGQGAYYIDGDWRVGAFITDQSINNALISPARQNDILITVFPDIEGAKINKSASVVLSTGWAMSAAIESGSAKEEAAWRLIKWLAGREVLSFRIEAGAIPTPSRIDIDYSNLKLEPMQVAIAALGNEYNRTTVVIDGAFVSSVFESINNGLQAIGMGKQTPLQAAVMAQTAFDAWKKTQ